LLALSSGHLSSPGVCRGKTLQRPSLLQTPATTTIYCEATPGMAPRLRPVGTLIRRRGPPSSSAWRSSLMAPPRRFVITLLLLVAAVFYTVYFTPTSSYYDKPESSNQNKAKQRQPPSKQLGDIDSVIDKIWKDADVNDASNNQELAKEDTPQQSKAPDNNIDTTTTATTNHRVAALQCDSYGGPTGEEDVREMVYWRDIPNDAEYRSPLKHESEEQFFTFEPDEGGW